ncbi:MAG TPA: CaiB/BaiF CoA-transferase family protein [Chloroflexota bacterium]|nr:CaiB/BaiF CoA-transferase family protein [Chloroflexota bacterium]
MTERGDVDIAAGVRSEERDGALSDLLVLDLSRVLAGPYATMLLGDMGARIIKIERPDRGDETREWGPPFTPAGQSAYYLSVNRNKESVAIDLKTDAGREVVRDLAQRADILIENFKVGTMDALGLGYETLRSVNPRLIYCAITGYGQTGPYRERPGYDTVIQAQGGLMSITGPVEGEPSKVGVAVADVTAGLYAATSILAALHHRDRTGHGQSIDIALFDVQLSWLVNVASAYLVSGQPPRRYGNAHPTIVPYGTVPTADGWLMLAVGNDGQFAAMARVVGRPDLAEDERYATNPARVMYRTTLIPELEAIFRTRTTAEWIADLLAVGVPAGPVSSIPEALNDPQARARHMVRRVPGVGGEEIPLVGPAAKMSETPPSVRIPPPDIGQDTEHIVREVLGYSDERIGTLRDSGAVGNRAGEADRHARSEG